MSQYFDSFFKFDTVTDKIGIIAQEGSLEFARKVDRYLVKWYNLAAAAKEVIVERRDPFVEGNGHGEYFEGGAHLVYVVGGG